jgi:hypothetical protein
LVDNATTPEQLQILGQSDPFLTLGGLHNDVIVEFIVVDKQPKIGGESKATTISLTSIFLNCPLWFG